VVHGLQSDAVKCGRPRPHRPCAKLRRRMALGLCGLRLLCVLEDRDGQMDSMWGGAAFANSIRPTLLRRTLCALLLVSSLLETIHAEYWDLFCSFGGWVRCFWRAAVDGGQLDNFIQF